MICACHQDQEILLAIYVPSKMAYLHAAVSHAASATF